MIMIDRRHGLNKQSFLDDDSERTVTPPVLSEKVDIVCELVGGCRLSTTTNKDTYEDVDASSWMPYCVVERQGKVIHQSRPANGGGANPAWTISTGNLFLISILTTTAIPSDLKISVWTNKASTNEEEAIPMFLGQARLSDVAWLANPKERTVELDLLDQYNESSCGGTLTLRLKTATEADLRLVQMVHKLHSLLQKVSPPSINNDSDDDDDKELGRQQQTVNHRRECLRERAQNLMIQRQPIIKEALVKQAGECREDTSFSDENLENREPSETRIKKEVTKTQKTSVRTNSSQPVVIGKKPNMSWKSKGHPVVITKTSTSTRGKTELPSQFLTPAKRSSFEIVPTQTPTPTTRSKAQGMKGEQPSFSMPVVLSSLIWVVYAIEQLDSSYASFQDLTPKSNIGDDKNRSNQSYWSKAIQQHGLIPKLPSLSFWTSKHFNRNRRQQQQHLQLKEDDQISEMQSLVSIDRKRSLSSSTSLTMTRIRNTRHYLIRLLLEEPCEETLISFWLTFAILLGEMTTSSRQEAATTTMTTSTSQLYLESAR